MPHPVQVKHPKARKDPRLERRSIATDIISSVGHFFGTFFKSEDSGRVQQLAGIRSEAYNEPRASASALRDGDVAAKRAALRELSAHAETARRTPSLFAEGIRRDPLQTAGYEQLSHSRFEPAAPADGPNEAAAAVVDSLFVRSSLAARPMAGQAARTAMWEAEDKERRHAGWSGNAPTGSPGRGELRAEARLEGQASSAPGQALLGQFLFT